MSDGALLWDDLDQDHWSKITRIPFYQENRWIRDQTVLIGSYYDLCDLESLILTQLIPK